MPVEQYVFGPFRLNCGTRQLLRDDQPRSIASFAIAHLRDRRHQRPEQVKVIAAKSAGAIAREVQAVADMTEERSAIVILN
jgi:hypothetical protein